LINSEFELYDVGSVGLITRGSSATFDKLRVYGD